MVNIVIACTMLREQLEQAIRLTGAKDAVFYLPEALHNHPQKLKAELSNLLQKLPPAEHILYGGGLCGNALLGLSFPAPAVIPRFDDCISMFLYNGYNRLAAKDSGCYYLTPTWLGKEGDLWNQYLELRRRYGNHTGGVLMERMLKGYHSLCLIDFDVSQNDLLWSKVQLLAEEFVLKPRRIKGSLVIWEKLLAGVWDDDFIILPAGEKLTFDHFGFL